MTRLFFALWPDAPVRDALAALAAQAVENTAPAGPIRPENLHLTLAFLGAVPQERLPAVRQIADGVHAEPVALRLDRLEYWAPGPLQSLCCATPSVMVQPLAALEAQLRTRLRAGELPVDERPYRPHVSLCRTARAAITRMASPVAPIDWLAQDFVLAESASGRPVYRILGQWKLGNR